MVLVDQWGAEVADLTGNWGGAVWASLFLTPAALIDWPQIVHKLRLCNFTKGTTMGTRMTRIKRIYADFNVQTNKSA